MRDKGKPFVLYRRGPMNFTIVPRGVKGWLQFGVWLALLVPMILRFADQHARDDAGSQFYAALGVFLFGLLFWSIAMIWWMIARADVVDVPVRLRDKQRGARKRRRRGRER